MREISWWEKDTYYRDRQVIIVGGGLVGLSTAISIKEKDPKADVLVVERSAIPYGASTRNAGFACFGSVSELLEDLNSHSEIEVQKLAHQRWQGLRKLRERLTDKYLQYKQYGGFELFSQEEQAIYNICTSQISYLNQLLTEVVSKPITYKLQQNKYGFKIHGELIHNQHEGQLHPGLMMEGLHSMALRLGIDILTDMSLEKYEASNTTGIELHFKNSIRLKCDKLLICTNAFTPSIIEGHDIIAGRNQVMMTKPIRDLKLQGCFHYNKGYVYFRNFGDRLLIGGGRNIDINENTDQFGTTQKIQDYLRSLLTSMILPNIDFEEDQWWSGIIATGESKKPIIQEISNNVYMGVRLGGMGVALGSLLGEELADLVI